MALVGAHGLRICLVTWERSVEAEVVMPIMVQGVHILPEMIVLCLVATRPTAPVWGIWAGARGVQEVRMIAAE